MYFCVIGERSYRHTRTVQEERRKPSFEAKPAENHTKNTHSKFFKLHDRWGFGNKTIEAPSEHKFQAWSTEYSSMDGIGSAPESVLMRLLFKKEQKRTEMNAFIFSL